MDTPKWVQGWLTDRRWEDEESLTPQAFAKKHKISGTFIKLENDIYFFEEKEPYGLMIYTYNREGKMVRYGERQERKTEEGTIS